MIQAYHHLIESYQSRPVARSHAQKRSEIRRAYENILKLSKNTGFYKLDMSKENQAYTIGVKELAISLQNRVAEMTNPGHPAYHQEYVSVSDESTLEAKLVSKDTSRLPANISITVESLAAPQINEGREIFAPTRSLVPGKYQFTARVMEKRYELSFELKEKISNGSAVKRLADYLQREIPELYVSVEENKRDYSRIRIISDKTGVHEDSIFSFEASDPEGEIFLEFFDLNHIYQESENAHFILNGQEKQTLSNTFQIENTLQVTLCEANDQPVTLKLLNATKKLLDRTDSILNSYNELIHLAKSRSAHSGDSFSARKLINELKRIGEIYREELEANGLVISDDGTIYREAQVSDEAAKDGRLQEFFTNKNGFIAALLGKAEEIAINPVEYLDKTVVTYPDSRRPKSNPYMTSLYSGLFFSSYC